MCISRCEERPDSHKHTYVPNNRKHTQKICYHLSNKKTFNLVYMHINAMRLKVTSLNSRSVLYQIHEELIDDNS